MENMSNPEQHINETPNEIATRLADEANRAVRTKSADLQPPRNRQAVDFNDYKNFIDKMLGLDPDKLLTPELLKKRIDEDIMQSSNLKFKFRAGYRCFPAIVACNNMGNPLSIEDIQEGAYLRTFIVNKSGKTVDGFGGSVSYVGDLIPTEIQNNGFTIGEYEEPGENDITDTDRKNLADQYTEAFWKHLQSLKA